MNVDRNRPTLSGIFMGKTMQAMTPLSPQTMAELGIPADSEVHSVHDDVDALDFVEVHHD